MAELGVLSPADNDDTYQWDPCLSRREVGK
jgi:hypothetical protein